MRPPEIPNDGCTEFARRSILRVGALAVGGLVVGGVGTVAGEEDNGHLVPGKYPPNPNVDFTRIFLFGVPGETAPTGDWIQHVVGFNPPGAGKNSVERFIKQHSMSVEIGDEEVENPKQYWMAALNPSDEWIAVWAYTTPPQSPGTYEYNLEITYFGQTFPLAGSYQVTESADESK